MKLYKKIILLVAIAVLSYGLRSWIFQTFEIILKPLCEVSYAAKMRIIEYKNIEALKTENEILSREIKRLSMNQASLGEYRKKIDTLESLLRLKTHLDAEYETVSANVIAYSSDNWYDSFVINKGASDGISIGDSVVADDGIVGKIIKVSSHQSHVATIINADSVISVRSRRSGTIAAVRGDMKLLREKQMRMIIAESTDGFNKGDYLETTGAGENYPEGYAVGTVAELFDGSGVVIPAVDLTDVYEVIVVKM